MAKARSPRYPSIGLSEAVEKVRLVYQADHLNEIPKNVVAEHMNYNSLNGKSLGVISSLSKYGLLQGRAEKMRVSDRALAILVNEHGEDARIAAVGAAAHGPELFAEIFEEFPTKISDKALRAYLLGRKKFLPNAAEIFIRSMRETEEYLENETGTDEDIWLEEENNDNGDENLTSRSQDRVTPTFFPAPTVQRSAPAPSDATMGFDIAFVGTAIRMGGIVSSKAEAEKVIQALQALSALLPDAEVESEPKSGGDDNEKIGSSKIPKSLHKVGRKLDLD